MIGPVYPSDSIAEILEKRIQVVEKEGMEPMANTIPAAAMEESITNCKSLHP